MASWYGNTDYQMANPRLLEQAAGGGIGGLKVVGEFANQMTADRLKEEAAARQEEQLAMQKAEHQMKVDAEKRALEELANTKAFNVGLAKPREMAEANAIYNQNNNPLLQKQIKDIAFTDAENAAYSNALTLAGGKDAKEEAILEQLKTSADPVWQNAYNKSVQQSALGKLGSTMASDPAYQETRLQQGTRLLAAMGDKAPLSAIKQVEEMRAAETASEAAKAKDAREAGSKAQEDLVKLGIEAMKLEGRNGTTITTDDGTVLSLGGKGKVPSKFDFNEAQIGLQNKASDAGYEKLGGKIEAAGRGKLKDLTDKQQDMLRKSFYDYVGAGYKPGEVADAVFASLPKESEWWEAWKKNPTEIKLSNDTLDSLAPGKEGLAKERAAQLETAQYNHILAQAKSAGGSGKSVLEAYAPYYQGKIAKADAESKLLAMPLEKRQMQSTAGAMGSILTPKEDVEAFSGQSSAKTINPTNIVPKQKESFDATVDRVVDYHKATPVAGYALATMPLLESGFEPNVKGDKGSAQGIYQHRLDRLDALKKFGNTDDVSKIPAEVQTDFAVKELRERPATPQFEKEYRKTNPDARFVSQWDELNSKKTAGEAAAYLSEHFEVAKGASKNPNIKEAMKEEAARRGKIADEIFGADHDEFGQNKRKVNKAEEEMLKNGPKVLPTQEVGIDTERLRIAAAGDPYSIDTINAKTELLNREKNKKTLPTILLEKPSRDWTDDDIKQAAILPDVAKSKKDWNLVDIAKSIGGNTPIRQDPAKTKALAILADRATNSKVDAREEEPGLESADLDLLMAGTAAKKVGSTVLPVVQYGASKTPILNKFVNAPVLPAPKVVENVTETLKRANDFNKIGIWRELRSRGVEVTDAMVEEILRKGKVLPTR